MQSLHLALFVGAALLFIGLLLGTLSTRVGVPSLLVFLVVGMLAGEDGIGGIQFQDFELGFLVSNLALAIILLDGGLRTRLSTFRAGLKPALTLATLGVLLTAMSVGAFATWLLGIDWRLGLLLGGIIGSTDAAAVFNVIKGAGLRLNERVESTLEIESGLNDPMAIFITVLLIDLLTLPDAKWGLETLVVLVQQFGLGALLGVALGAGLAELLLRVRSNEGLHALLLCTGGAAIFSLTNMVGGSGFLAVYLVGLIAGNRRAGTSDNVLRSMDSMAWLAQSGMFLLLGLLVTPTGLITSLVPGLLIALFLTFIARPVAVWMSLLPFAFSNREKTFIAWTGLRGAVPIVLAVFPLLAGVPENRLLFDITFVVVLTSLLLQGTSIGLMARRMRVALPPAASPLAAVALEGAEDQFLVQFRIQGGSRAEGKTMDQVASPGVQPVALVRGGVALNLADNPVLEANDLLTWLTSHAEQEQLGEWFLATTATLRRFYGDFTVRASARVSDVAMSYGLTDLSPALMGMTLEELFHQRHKGTPVVGDTIELGGIRLRVRSLERGQVHQVGIRLPKI
ncbi:potassium/proton antiporter [Alcanivorax sp. JB21]|uniref:potassium/proton antiporter n=1 Tax=Alcanivorax limicola TaxID=2874102 RepID=UPI001CBDAB4D|nr:potassium/proton antiporter [Alcanivorax limicola]MBZ2188934.1 potassium/proton antiporter [Alcanivorax limicola]